MSTADQTASDPSPRGPRRRWLRLLAVLVISVGAMIAAALAFLPQIARPLVLATVERLELGDVDFASLDIGWRSTSLSKVTAGVGVGAAADLTVETLTLTYTPLDLLHGHISTVSVDGGLVRGTITDNRLDLGVVSQWIERFSPTPSDPPSDALPAGPPPVESIALRNSQVVLDTPRGPVEMDVSGGVFLGTGQTSLDLQMALRSAMADLEADVALAGNADGWAGDVRTATGVVRTPDGDIDVTASGRVTLGADDTSGDMALMFDGAVLRGDVQVTVARNSGVWSGTFASDTLASAHPALRGAVSARQMQATAQMTLDGAVSGTVTADVTYAADGQAGGQAGLPVSAISTSVPVRFDYQPERGVLAVYLTACMPVSVTPAAGAGWQVGDTRLCAAGDRALVTAMVGDASAGIDVVSRFTMPATKLGVAGLVDGTAPAIDATVTGSTVQAPRVALTLRGGDLLLREQSIAVSDIAGRLSYVAGQTGQVARLDVGSALIRDLAAAQRFAPVTARADLSVDVLGEDTPLEGVVSGPFSVATPKGVPLASGTVRHELATGKGRADFATGTQVFAEKGLQPQALAPVLRGVVAVVSGTASAQGTLNWTRAGIAASSAQVTMAQLGFQAPVARFDGVSGTLAFSSLVPVRTDGPQKIILGVIDPGLPLEGGEAMVEVRGGGEVVIENANWPFAGGQLVLTSGALNTQEDIQYAELSALQLDLAQLLTLIDLEGLSGAGVLEGAVPIEIRDASVYVVNAQLAAQPGGVIRYVSATADAAGQVAEGANIAFQALENFQFEVLSVDLDGPVDGDLTARIVLKGANPELLEGYPVHLTITTQGAFMDLLRRGTVGFRALDVVTGKEDLGGIDVERVDP